MSIALNRRTFLAGALAAPWITRQATGATAGEIRRPDPSLDIHVHLFGVGEGGTGCRISRSITDGWTFRLLVGALRLRVEGTTLDARYEQVLAEQVGESGLDGAAILGQDAVYDHLGQPDWNRTSFYVPNDYVFAVASRHSQTMIPCPSINPDRADALDEVARCHARGARLFKIHPPTQGVDVADRKHLRFFRRCTELNMAVLVHTGHEHSAPVIDRHLAGPRRLEFALDQGCTIVACHAGTGWTTDTPDQLPEFVALLRRYPKLWGDTAVLGSTGRVRDFGRLLDNPFVRDRLLHGSDFPFPVNPSAFRARIGDEAAERIGSERNWLKKDLDLKEALGIGLASARRAYQVASAGWISERCNPLTAPIAAPECPRRRQRFGFRWRR